jgi:peptide subunit release factor 1 (eRF1)
MGEKSKAKYEMKKKLRELSNIAGSGTELISVYIPPKYPIADVSNKLKAEYGQAANIKSKSTRKNVLDALEKIINYLKIFREPPENGIAIFCGNVSKEQGRPDIKLYSISPPEQIHVQLYRCDSSFFLEPLEEMLEAKDIYGLVVMDGREATIAVLKGKQTRIVRKLTSTAHSKLHGKGGQCVDEDTLVRLASGEVIRIKEVKKGDEVFGYNFNDHNPMHEECAEVFRRKAHRAYLIRTTSPALEIRATPEHKFFVATEDGIGEKYAEELRKGNWLLAVKVLEKTYESDIILARIDKKTIYRPRGFFYDLTMPKNESFIANGLIVHNSARRYERLIEESIEKYYKRIGDAMDEVFVNIKNLRGIIVGGPGPAKEDFMKLSPFNYQLKVLGVVDTGYTEEYGIKELTEKAEPLIAEQEAVKEKLLVDRFIKEVVKDGLATYGEKEVRDAIEKNKVETLLLSEGLDIRRSTAECSNCGRRESGIAGEPKACSCGGKMRVVEEKELADELIELAESKNVKVEMISTETAEGSQFLQGFRGIGAFLRYR